MIQRFKNLPIRIKIISGFTLVLFLVSMFNFIYFPLREKQRVTKALEEKAETVTEMLAAVVVLALNDDDFEFVNQLFNVTKSDSNIIYISILDENRRQFISFNPRQIQISLPESAGNKITFEKQGVLHAGTALRIDEGVYGTLMVGLSLQERNKEIARIRLTGLAVSLLILLLGILISFRLSALLTGRLQKVINTIHYIGKTAEYRRLPANGCKDEVGQLIDAFNDMIQKIQIRTFEIKRSEEELRLIVEGTSAVVGDECFRSLARCFATALGVRYALLTETRDPANTRVRSLAFWTGEDFAKNIEYDLPGTPCAGVADGEICFYPENVQATFPDDRDLIELDAESYFGAPIFDSRGRVIGHLVALDDKPMQEDPRGLPIVQIFAGRAAIELERKQAEEKLRKLSRAVEQSPSSVVITDTAGCIEYVNPKFTEVTGYKAREAMGKNPKILNFGKSQPEMYEQLWQTISSGGEWRGEFLNKKKSGELYWEYASISPIKNAEGAITHYVAVKEDITERKRFEAELQKAKEAAEAANRAKSEFLANMSHEIRTPMNGIIGMNHLLLETELDNEQREYADAVRISAESLLSLINDILDFSKIEAGKLDLENIDFALAEVVEGVADMIAPKAHDKGLELLVSIDDNIPSYLQGDPSRIRQVLLNLAGNAVKFTEKGEIIIKAELQSAECGMRSGEWGVASNQYSVISNQTEAIAGGHEVKGEEQGNSPDSSGQPEKNSAFQTPKSEIHKVIRFSVTDTGIGIPKEKQHLVFESFSQADGSTTRKYGGTGLGLTISKQLAMLMGGEIGVESPALPSKTFKDGRGKGSTFWFTVRLATHPRSEKARKGVPADISALEGRRMLVIDDNATNRLILKKIMENHGCLVETVNSGMAALDVMQNLYREGQSFDFILLDMMMPEMDGKETARRIRESEPGETAIIIMASSAGTKPAKEEMQQLGIRHYLTKPVKIASLLRILLQSIDGDNTGETSPKVTVVSADDLNPKHTPRLHILLAEDNIVNQKLATRLLEKNGFSVDVVANGIEAVEALERINYDLVLMDMQMPEMDGLEATMMIREKEKSTGGHIPIIALTANAMKGDRDRCLAAGMDGYVSKPIRKEELFDAIAGLSAQSVEVEPREFAIEHVDEECEHLKQAQITSGKENSQ